MNNIFFDLLDVYIVVYLDDIFIYSDNLKDYKDYMKEILQCLRTNKLYTFPSKCTFH